jgi:hypothetical protein
MTVSDAATTPSVSSFLAIYTFSGVSYSIGKGSCLFSWGWVRWGLGFLRGMTRIQNANWIRFKLFLRIFGVKLATSQVTERDEMT